MRQALGRSLVAACALIYVPWADSFIGAPVSSILRHKVGTTRSLLRGWSMMLPESGPTFEELYGDRLPQWLTSRASELGFTRPTEVQRAALDTILDGEDVVLQAQTGSGKTLSFMLPLLASIDPTRKAVQALVVVPSRELGLQVASVAKRLASGRIYHHDEEMGPSEGGEADPTPTAGGASGRILVMSLLDGSKNRRQRVWVLAEPPQLVIGNPAALCNLVTSGRLRYHNVKMVVLDEVDAILLHRDTRAELHNLLAKYLSPSYLNAEIEDAQEGGGAGEEAQMLVAAGLMKKGEDGMAGAAGEQLTPHKLTRRQTIFCSATIPQHNHFLKQCVQNQWTLQEPVHVQVRPGELMPSQLQHSYLVCPDDDPARKMVGLRSLLRRLWPEMQACIIFTLSDDDARDVAGAIEQTVQDQVDGETQQAEDDTARVQVLSRSDNIRRRGEIMEAFRQGKCRVLITTDFASRGLDIPEVTHVIQFSMAEDADSYVHRGGRAGRMGRPGSVITLVWQGEEFVLLRQANSLGIEMKRLGVVSRGSKGTKSKQSSSSGGKKKLKPPL